MIDAAESIIVDPPLSAEQAGLVYMTDDQPGITRRRAGKGFVYRDVDGRRISDRQILDRLRRLAIPPAWTRVWISAGPPRASARDGARRPRPQAAPLSSRLARRA